MLDPLPSAVDEVLNKINMAPIFSQVKETNNLTGGFLLLLLLWTLTTPAQILDLRKQTRY
jgi:hypothetical protein